MPETLEELRASERKRDREWSLHGALRAVAQMRADRATGLVTSFREMQKQGREVERRRAEIAVRITELEEIDDWRSGSSKR